MDRKLCSNSRFTVKLNLPMICFMIRGTILTNTKRNNIFQTMKIPLFTLEGKLSMNNRRKKLFTVQSDQNFFMMGARPFHLPVVT